MYRQIIVSLAALALVSGCEQFDGAEGGTAAVETGSAAEPGVLRVEQRQVERPDIFASEASGLWDGRISLGGRWVAIPGEIKADRVRITNKSNGTIIEGALFQRDANLPGPYFMVSMDAAQALGMTPGVPADLRVVVIRTESVEVPAPAPAPAEEPLGESEARDAADAATGGAVAAGAIAATALPDAEAPAAAPVRPEATDRVTSPLEDTVLDALSRVGTAPAAPAPAATATGAPPAPYLQVASGSNREGADAVSRRVEAADLSATVRSSDAATGTIYRVIVGPFETRAEYNAARAVLRGLGYEDAFATQ